MGKIAREPDAGPLPRHVAIIMDGNGRWARRRHLPRAAGHAAGVNAVRDVVRAAGEVGLSYLTLYAFSSENWKRPPSEIDHLMGLFRAYFQADLEELVERGVRVRVIGNRGRVASDISDMIKEAERRTAANVALNLTVAFDYGSRQEIVAAARELAREAAAGILDPGTIGEEDFAGRLFTQDLPDPDLVIRTSGERRLSNFLLWQAAYSEFVFLDVLWPDFTRKEFLDALEEFAGRERRFGAAVAEPAR